MLNDIDESLSVEDGLVLEGVAVLLGYPGTRSAIETTLNASDLRRQLRFFGGSFFVDGPRISQNYCTTEYLAHYIHSGRPSIYRDAQSCAIASRCISVRVKSCVAEEPDLWRAALHFTARWGLCACGEPGDCRHLGHCFIQGSGPGLLQLLQRFKASQLSPELWAQIQIAQGDLQFMVGDGQTCALLL